MQDSPQRRYMHLALKQARLAVPLGEIPVGAVLVDGERDVVLAAAHNETRRLPDPTAHAEMLVLRRAAAILSQERLPHCDLYVTLEPCPMCAQALSFARVRRLYFGAYDPKGGGVESGARIFDRRSCFHTPEIYGGFAERECGELLRRFFQEKRG